MAPIIKSDSGSVDSSSIISALGFTPFNETGDTLTGTGGAGFYGAIPQSSAPSTPGSGFRLYANASGLLEWKGTNGFTRTFDGAANTADRTYTLPNASGTIALEGTLTSLANPTIQNGFYQFAQNTKPTQRAAGVPLVAGDRWYNTSDGTEWFWNGTYWVGEQLEISHDQLSDISQVSPTWYFGTINTVGSVLVDRVVAYIFVPSPNDTSNYWTINVSLAPIQGAPVTITSFSTANDIPGMRVGKQSIVNYVYNSGFPGVSPGAILCISLTRTGIPNTLYACASVRYRHIAP